ncbi:hypothetical protein [Anaerotignum lactatifermentans]|uniref:hypothetical protein n=1 Tax=Anaerotignum lactatifermentans TaxID=160404 RepID=UPI003AB8C4D6
MRSIEEIKNKAWKDRKDIPAIDTGSVLNTSFKLFDQYREATKPKVTGGTVNPTISYGNVRENPVLKRKENTAKTYSQALEESRNRAKTLEMGAKLPTVIPPKGDVSKLILPDTGGGGTVNPTLKRNEVRTNYDYMTDREAAVYKYYRDRGQVEKAQEYLDALEMDVNQRAAMQKREDAKKLAEESTAAALYARAVGNIGQAAGAVYAAAMEGADKPVDPYHPLMGGVNMNEGLYEGLMGESTGANKVAKDIGLGVFDWGTQAALLGPATPYVMAAGAMAGNTKDALERGGTMSEAVEYGVIGGAAEAATEKLGYDRLFKYGANAIAKKLGHAGLFELSDKIADKGALAKFLWEVMPHGVSEGLEEATSEFTNIVADTLVLGDNSQMKQIAQTAMENGATESEAVKTALQQGFLQVIYSGAIGAASGGVIAGGIGGLSRAKGRNALEMAGNPAGVARDAMTNAGNEVTQRTNAMRSQGKAEVPEGTTQGNVLPEQGNVLSSRENMLPEQGNVLSNRENMLPEQGNVMVNRENVPEVTQQNKALRDFGEKYYYTEGQKVVNEEAERRGDTSFIPAFQTYYTAGLTGVKESDIKQTAETIVADKGLLRAAYLAGVNDRKADLEARMKGTGKMGQTVGVFLETDAVTKEQRSLAELVSRVAELEVVLVDELPQDRRGYYENNKGRVTIALNSGQFAGTLFHEATHYLREANPEGYDRMRQAVFSAAAAMKGMDTEAYIKSYEKRYGEAYREAGQEAGYDVILEEMTADAFAEIAGNEKSLRAFVMEMQQTNPSVLEKIKEFLENLLETLKGLVNDGRFSSFGEEIRKDIKETEKLAKMLAEEMKKAGEMQRGEKTSIKNRKQVFSDINLEADPKVPGTEVRLSYKNKNDLPLMENITQSKKEDNGKERESENRFSLKEPIEETKDLIAVHNLTGEKLRKLLDLQGIPMPSIAITKSDATAEDFGEISLVFRKDTIDPADERNKVYDADAWTPMFPTLDKEEYRKTRAFLEELVRTMQAQTKSGKNAQGFMGENTMRAAMANRFVSLGEIKEAREKLEHLPKEEFEALREEMNQRLFGVLEEIYDTGSQTGINEVYEMEDIGEQIQNMAEEVKGVPGAQQIQQNLKKAGYPISMELAEQTARVLEEIKEMPTNFFEAKPERVVEFAEVAAAVVPDELEADLRKAVENKISQVLEYEAGSKESRVRQLNRVEGVRFSIREEAYDALVEENEALKEANEALRRQLEITKDAVHDPVSAKKAVRKWLKSINSTYDADIFTEKFVVLADYVANAGDKVDFQKVMGALQKLAYDALSESKVLNTDLSDAYKDFKDDVRKTKIKVTEDMAEEFDYYGGYNTVRKENFGKINLSRQGGIYADVFYQEMAEKYPELLDVERVSTQVDVVMDLLDVVDSLQPIYENPYGMNLDEYAMDAAYDLWEMYFDIELQKPTFADKYEKKLEKEKARARAARENLRKDLKERYDEKLQQAKEDQKKKLEDARLAAAMHEGRALVKQRRAIYEKLKARDKERRDRAEYAKYKNIIEKEAALLKRWVERPTDQYHVQESMMEGVRNFLEKMKFDDPDLNIMPTDIHRMMDDYKAMTDENAMLYAEEDENVNELLKSLDKRVGNGIKVSELGPTEMRQLSVVIRSVSHLVRNANKMVSIKNGQKISAIGDAYMEDVQNKKTKNPDSRLRVLSDMMNVQMLDTESFFKEMGKTVHDTIYRGLREGFDRKILHVKEASEFMQKTVDKKKIREWGEMEPKEYTLSGGKISLTDAQIMSLYCLMRRTQARGHIFGGGIKGEPVVHKVRGEKGKREIVKNTKPVKVTAADVTKLMSNLTEEQKKAALEIQGYLESVASWGNEVTMNMLGYKKFTETNYFPIVTDENYINTMYGARGEKNSTLKTMGITKQTNKEAKNPIILENIFDAYVRHIDQMSSYNAFVPALSDLNKFMNYREMVRVVDGKSFGENRSVKETMQRVMGPAGQRYISDLADRLNNPAVKEDVERLPRIFLRNMKIASVGANLRVIIQQPVSYLRAADEIGVGYLMGALVPSKTDFEKVYEYAPIAQWKEWGNYEMNVGRTMKELLIGQNFYESFLEKSMIAAGVMDKLTWGRIWRAAELEVKKKHPELTGNRYYETVGKRFSEIIDGTQVVDSILHRNQMMRSTSLYSQMFTSFMSEPTKTYNMMRNSMVAVIKDNTPENRKKVVRTFMTLVANGVCVAAAAGLVDMLRDDDDDETLLEKWLQAFRGDFSEAESVSDYILAAIGSNLGNSFNPLGYIPYMRDIFSVLQGYKVERTDISWLNDLVKSGKNLMRYMSGESNYTLNAVLMDAAGSLSKATGIPIHSAKRDILAIKNTIVNYTLGLDAQYENQKLTYNVGSEKNISMYVKMMLEAKMSGNEQIATRIYNDMVNGGISNEKIDNKIKTEQVKAIKEEPEAMEAAKAYNEGRVDDYIRNVEALAKKGYFMANIESAVESLTKPPAEDEETFETITKDYWKEEGEVESADYALLFNAYMNGNMADYDKMWSILNAAGKEDKDIRSSMRSRLKSEYWKAKEAGDSQRMQRAADEFYRLGGKRETLEKPPK